MDTSHIHVTELINMCIRKLVQLALHIGGSYSHRFNQLRVKNIFFKNPESSKEEILNLMHTGIYLHSTYIVFTTIYTTFTLYKDDLKYMEDIKMIR